MSENPKIQNNKVKQFVAGAAIAAAGILGLSKHADAAPPTDSVPVTSEAPTTVTPENSVIVQTDEPPVPQPTSEQPVMSGDIVTEPNVIQPAGEVPADPTTTTEAQQTGISGDIVDPETGALTPVGPIPDQPSPTTTEAPVFNGDEVTPDGSLNPAGSIPAETTASFDPNTASLPDTGTDTGTNLAIAGGVVAAGAAATVVAKQRPENQ